MKVAVSAIKCCRVYVSNEGKTFALQLRASVHAPHLNVIGLCARRMSKSPVGICRGWQSTRRCWMTQKMRVLVAMRVFSAHSNSLRANQTGSRVKRVGPRFVFDLRNVCHASLFISTVAVTAEEAVTVSTFAGLQASVGADALNSGRSATIVGYSRAIVPVTILRVT